MDRRLKEICLGQAINIVSKVRGLPDWNNTHQIDSYSEQVKEMYSRIIILHKSLIKED